MLAPFVGWAITGFVFFVKPGYDGAYENLSPKTYPFVPGTSISPDSTWLEFRCLRTVLGDHLIVRTAAGWQHLNPVNLQLRGKPTSDEMKLLLTDAVSVNTRRYGRILTLVDDSARTDTGIEIKVDWNRLALQQRGRDTDLLDLLYKIHYLQWTGIRSVDRILGLAGLTLILALSALGARLAFKRN